MCLDAKPIDKINKDKKRQNIIPGSFTKFLVISGNSMVYLVPGPLNVIRVTEDKARGERDLYVQLKTTAVTDCSNPELTLVSEQAVLHGGQGHD